MNVRPFILLLGTITSAVWACQIHGTESGFCETRYLSQTYQSSSVSSTEAQRRANAQWQNGTQGPCEHGQSDFCMPFCVR